MRKKTQNIVIAAAIVCTQPFWSTVSNVAAQTYGDSAYGGGVYNNSSVDEDNPDETPNPGGATTDVPVVSQQTVDTSSPPQPGDTPVDNESPSDGSNDPDDGQEETSSDNPSAQTKDESSSQDNFLQRLGLGALAAAALIFIIILAARKRRSVQG